MLIGVTNAAATAASFGLKEITPVGHLLKAAGVDFVIKYIQGGAITYKLTVTSTATLTLPAATATPVFNSMIYQ